MSEGLLARIKRQIALQGPLSVGEYMGLCLGDAQAGYYTTATPFGAKGDFITAPEVSQMFGELIGVWCVAMWRRCGAPAPFSLVEFGPGRGTLMADLLRAAATDSEFSTAARPVLVETSWNLRDIQHQTLGAWADETLWLDSMDQLDGRPALFIGNEFLDALPFRQYVKSGNRWQERMIGLVHDELALVIGASLADPSCLPREHRRQPDGTIFEIAPAREAVVETVARHVAAHGGAGLMIDYGHTDPGFGDTFQAVSAHRFADPLGQPGRRDLTSHVDFSALGRRIAAIDGVTSLITTQGAFLLAMGLIERAGALGHGKPAGQQEAIRSAVERLAGADQMGALFKVLAIASPDVAVAGFPPAAPEAFE